MKVCRKCGAPLRDTDRYCSQCGARVSSGRNEERVRRRQEKKQRDIYFQSKPGRQRAVDSFEEYENRSRALGMTVKVLIAIIVLTAAVVFGWAWKKKIWMFSPSSQSGQQVVVIQAEEDAVDRVESELSGELEAAEQRQET